MKLLAIGDSFTYGEELSDLNKSWPNRLGEKLGYAVINLGEPASSNDSIIRRLLEYLLTRSDQVDLVVIGWSMLGRQEFADDVGHYSVWPGYSGNLFQQDGSVWRQGLVKYFNQYHNRQYYHVRYLEQVILVQNFLKSRNIKYIMMNVLENEYYRRGPTFFWQRYFEEIDKNYFIGFDHSGMVEWTDAAKCPKGPNGHFLDKGHELVADKIYEHIRNLGWLS
jgi:Family of unknown function (DUF6071)